MVGNEHDTLTALGKLEDSLEKLEPKTFGEFMTRFRQRRGVSQTSFAAALHISRDTVKAIEADKNTPSYETLLAITDVYNIPLDTLRFAFRRYAFHLKDEAIDYMIDRQDSQLIEPTITQPRRPIHAKLPSGKSLADYQQEKWCAFCLT